MKAKPILFSAPMIRALLDGSKTQTRRIIKLPKQFAWEDYEAGKIIDLEESGIPKCPYGQVGDFLWVRETWMQLYDAGDRTMTCLVPTGEQQQAALRRAKYKSTDSPPENFAGRWKPSIHMPRWASRITLKMTGVRIERIQDISEVDAKAEGVESLDSDAHENREGTDFDHSLCKKCGGLRLHNGLGANYGVIFDIDCMQCDTYVKRYKWLWESINGEGSWDLNPWVWAMDFETINKNIDAVLKELA